jgi:pyruvate carboxylase
LLVKTKLYRHFYSIKPTGRKIHMLELKHNLPFKKILVANRGEIAIRIMRAATELGLRTVGIYAYEDRFSLHRYKSDESYRIGEEGEPLKAYLDGDAVIEVAKQCGAEAIHPGYGLLSESAEFAEKCDKAGIRFIGPTAKILDTFGDKIKAKKAAKDAGISILPGTEDPVKTLEEAKKEASRIGYPLLLKAAHGGGGKGIRKLESEDDLVSAFTLAQSEALSSFGHSEIFLEKMVVRPKHIEIQIVGDNFGNIVHLFERDCSIQRRHQKVVELAPAIGINESTKNSLYEMALKIANHVNYQGLGTVEFLVDESGEGYFLEVNPRVQVEHTVTEVITGIDLIQASILIAADRAISHPAIGIKDQDSITQNGVAIQCRITTENPKNNFAPDTGTIIAYRPSAGFGIRLDEGLGTSGGNITPHYDSLLVKVTSSGHDLLAASRKMARSLAEFRIRGVSTNIPLLQKIAVNKEFLSGKFTTDFLEKNTELFEFKKPKDRATKLLRYVGEAIVNNPSSVDKQLRPSLSGAPKVDMKKVDSDLILPSSTVNAKQVFDKEGVEGLKKWIKNSNELLLTDTTMRDAHQSLFATRLRTKDILSASPLYDALGKDFFSLEVWGGATFDTSLRFLKEDPWERLQKLREKLPNSLLQMLLRGDNAVGYTNYPSWVVKDFISQTVRSGLDLFRIFDCFNQADKMKIAVEQVKKEGAIAEVCVCYTGNLADDREAKFTLKYYLDKVKELEAIGADIIAIKDMVGLLRPKAAKMLISEIKEHSDLPVHLHMHDTSGLGVTVLREASKAGVDIVDGAVSSMSGFTSQPSLNTLVASFEENERKPKVNQRSLEHISRYWEQVRSMYACFDPGIKSTSTEVYSHEIPGGQFSNLYVQANNVGLSADEFHDLTKRYSEVDKLFGRVVKVTPSSKVVGDMALLLQKNSLTGSELMAEKPELDYPDSVRSFFSGKLGIPTGGFNDELKKMVLGENANVDNSKVVFESDDTFETAKSKLSEIVDHDPTDRDVITFRLYPQVYKDYVRHIGEFGTATKELPTPTFFFGMKQGEEIEVDIETGKTLYLSLRGVSQPDRDGQRKVFFLLNGFRRDIEIFDQSLADSVKVRIKADPINEAEIGSPMPGKILELRAKPGEKVKKGQVVVVSEAMKMQYEIKAKVTGEIKEILVSEGDQVEGGDLIIRMAES